MRERTGILVQITIDKYKYVYLTN